jgi:hypothetical protein
MGGKQETESYKEYNALCNKMKNGTITISEKEKLFVLAFGAQYIKSKEKGKLKRY